MDSMAAFVRGQMSRGNRRKVFDWNKAATIIAERRPSVASAGLGSDWEWTGGTIYEDGAPNTDSYVCVASTWAVPELDLDGDVEECWRWEEDGEEYDASAKWPQSALDILNAAGIP